MATAPPGETLTRTMALAVPTVRVLRLTAGVAGFAALSELFRYVLLVLSLSGPVPAVPLLLSDVLVIASGVLLLVLGTVSGGYALTWLVFARRAAAELADVHNARCDWSVVLGILVPGWNLFAPGTAVAETEHTVLSVTGDRTREQRPNPSLLVRVWWLMWVVNLLLGWTGIAWAAQSSVQAQADGVLLHAWIAATVVVLALLTSRVVRYLRTLLEPDANRERRWLVVRVRGAALPPRRTRPRGAPR